MKKFAILTLMVFMAAFSPNAHAQYGRGASAGTEDAGASGWSWAIGGVAVAAVLAMGAVIGVYSSDTPTKFNHS